MDQAEKESSGSASRDAKSSVAPSKALREKGNGIYQQLAETLREGSVIMFSPVVSTKKLEQAKELYKQAMAAASSSSDERASCEKNLGALGVVGCKLYVKQLSVQMRQEGGEAVMAREERMIRWALSQHTSETVAHFLAALRHGAKDAATGAHASSSTCKPKEWIDSMIASVEAFLKWSSDESRVLCLPHSPLLQYVCDAFSKHQLPHHLLQDLSNRTHNLVHVQSSFMMQAHMNYSEALFHEALTKQVSHTEDSNIDYQACSPLLHDASATLRKAIDSCLPRVDTKAQGAESLVASVRTLERSVFVHQNICEGLRLINMGDKVLRQALTREEYLNMELVKDALDFYRQAVMAIKDMDMETEAMAFHHIGTIYGDVYKMSATAHKFYFQCVRLALTVMSPRIARSDWYKFSLHKVEEHQKRVVQEEDQERLRSRQPAVQRLRPQLDKLSQEVKKGPVSFLKFVYTEHPHKELRNNVIPRVNGDDELRQSLRTAILHYHPDKNGNHGEDWCLLCEEIVKHLNHTYTAAFAC